MSDLRPSGSSVMFKARNNRTLIEMVILRRDYGALFLKL